MDIVDIQQAKTYLSRLIRRVEKGEDVVIGRAGKPVAKLIPYRAHAGRRQGGQWRGLVRIRDDFDAPLPP